MASKCGPSLHDVALLVVVTMSDSVRRSSLPLGCRGSSRMNLMPPRSCLYAATRSVHRHTDTQTHTHTRTHTDGRPLLTVVWNEAEVMWLFVESRKIFVPHAYLTPLFGMTHWNFSKIVYVRKSQSIDYHAA